MESFVVEEGIHAGRWWRIAFVGPFIPSHALQSLWQMARHPVHFRFATKRVVVVMFLFLIISVVNGACTGLWAVNFDSQRCWSERTSNPPISIWIQDGFRPFRNSTTVHHELKGASYNGWMRHILHSVALFIYCVLNTFGVSWIFLLLGHPLLCAIICNIDRELSFRMALLMAAAFLPVGFLLTVMLIAKLAYMLFLIDVWLYDMLFFLYLALAFWPGALYVRAVTQADAEEWRKYLCASISGIVVMWPIFHHGSVLMNREIVLGWS